MVTIRFNWKYTIVIIFCTLVSNFFVNNINADTISDGNLPTPLKVIDFSYSFEELSAFDENFQIVDNSVKPTLVQDESMGQVLKLGKAVVSDEEFTSYEDAINNNSEYSTIKISNPFVGINHLNEYEDYENVKTALYGEQEQPAWKEGVTISYWIKSPGGVNSNVIGFSSERFELDATDYAKYLNILRFELEYNKYTENEREVLGIGPSGVLDDSDFYFEYAEYDENGVPVKYKNMPLYSSLENMGDLYYYNKFFEPGYIKNNDGTYSEVGGIYELYERYGSLPKLGNAPDDHDPGNSYIKYAWVYSEMWLDASSSFFFTDDGLDTLSKQLNYNNINTYNTSCGMQEYNHYCINSWNRWNSTFEEAVKNDCAAPSPLSIPDQWHNVTVVIQNDWVAYYLDGEEIDIEENYSSFGQDSLQLKNGYEYIFKYFNKGTGSRYGYGAKSNVGELQLYSDGYAATTMLEWLIMDSTQLTIGGGNLSGDDYNMYATTDGIMIKNIVFYDTILDENQIKYLADNAFIYDKEKGAYSGDVNLDGLVNAEDALMILKYSARLIYFDKYQFSRANVASDDKVNAKDALYVLKQAAKLLMSTTNNYINTIEMY